MINPIKAIFARFAWESGSDYLLITLATLLQAFATMNVNHRFS
jgi:hypothetical protein